MLYWVERIASHVRVASMIIGQKDSSVCFVLNQEPNMIVQQPLFFFHHTSRQWHTSLLGQGGLHRHHHYKKERQWQCNGTRSRSGDHWRQCNRDFRFDFGRISAFYHHAMLYTPTSSMVPTSPSTTRNLCFSKLLPPAHEYLHICTPWIGRARVPRLF